MEGADSAPVPSDEQRTTESNRGGSLSRRHFLAATGGVGATAIAGCMGTVDAGPETVSFGTLTIPAVAEVLVAQDRGYFADRNIELEIERIQSAPKATPQLASGDLDVATGSIGASLFNSVAADTDIWVVADQTQYWRGVPSSNRIWVRTDAAPDAESIYDLPEGLTIGLHGKGNVDSYIMGRILELNDMSWEDMETTETLYTQMPSIMAEGQIDACAIPDPLGLQVGNQADARTLGCASMVAPRLQVGTYLFGGPFAENNPDTATRWLEAYLEGVREYYELGGFPSDEVATIVSDAFDLPKSAIKASVPSLPHKNGHLNAESIENQQAYHACRGTVDETVPVGDVIDESFLEDALDTVGRLDVEEAKPKPETIEAWEETAIAPYPTVNEIREPEEFPTDSSC